MDTSRNSQSGQDPPPIRPHDDDGISPDADAVIRRHGLDRAKVLEWADHYKAKEGADFNVEPARAFDGAPLGYNLAVMAGRSPYFGQFRFRFNEALDSLDYDTSDDIISSCLADGTIVDRYDEGVYDWWKSRATRLEGLNVALYRAARDAPELHRFIRSPGELDNYRHGRWRREGDPRDRVSTTVGLSHYIMDGLAAARVSYNADALRDWSQPVRYSPYPRSRTAESRRFGHEKDGSMAGEGEVHVHVRCPVPAPKYVKIAPLPGSGLGRQDAIERYGDVGAVEAVQ